MKLWQVTYKTTRTENGIEYETTTDAGASGDNIADALQNFLDNNDYYTVPVSVDDIISISYGKTFEDD